MSKIAYLDLELAPPGLASHIKGWVVLGIGVTVFTATVAHYMLLRQKIDAIESAGSTTSQTQTKHGATVSSAEIKTINGSIEQITLPWPVLFAALEGVDAEDVNLLSIEPNTQKSSVNIVAEAQDVYAMLEYQRGLAAQPGLREVTLVQYEMRAVSNAEPVRFTISAGWGVAR